MNKNIWLKILSLSIAAVFCLSLLAACGKDTAGDGTGNGTDGAGDVADSETEIDVLEGVKYNGEVLKVLAWDPSNLEEYVSEFKAGSHVVEQKTYERMVKTKTQLNIGVEWIEEPGNGANMTSFIQKAVNGMLVNEYDVICCYSSVAADLAMSGYTANLLDYETMDFTQEWYPQNLVEDCTMNNKLYFCTGDISTNLINMTSMVFFNHQLVDDYRINDTIQSTYGEKDLYDLVRKGKWTHDAMLTLAKNVSTSGSTGIATENDTVGISTYSTLLCNFYYGMGYKTVNVSDSGVSLSEDYMDAGKMVELLEYWGAPLHESSYGYFCDGHNEAARMFYEGRSLFSLAPASHAYKFHAPKGMEFGALPVPVGENGDPDNPVYYSVHSRPYSMYLIPNGSAQTEIAASFIHCLGKISYETTRPAIINTTMKGRYASVNAEDAEMWDYIIDSQLFDIGRIYESVFNRQIGTDSDGNPIYRPNTDLFQVRLGTNDNNWASIIEKYKGDLEKQCQDINDKMTYQ